MHSLSYSIPELVRGLALLTASALVAKLLTVVVPLPALLVAVFIGILLTNLVALDQQTQTGLQIYKPCLKAGIVLMGVQFTLSDVVAAGPRIVLLVLLVILLSLGVVELLSARGFGLPSKFTSLLAAGIAICGTSAIAAVAGSIDPKEDHIAYAIATVLIFDTVAILVFPPLGRFLNLAPNVFGVWVGLSMFSTGPVAAAGFAYADSAGQWATLTKLTRNMFIGIVTTAYAFRYIDFGDDIDIPSLLSDAWKQFPKFVLGFLGMILLTNVVQPPAPLIDVLARASEWLFLLAFAGFGIQIHPHNLRQTGFVPLIVGLISLLLISIASLLLLNTAF
ncbi:putative sulfate exporter family transporter [Halobellus sp. H-GB7]|uniref:YeiH family protein n=1 Tax=Halobellus sp. H-GB7 TaxID=3069756 RepID=UPI0027B455CE|nr:putative sulfate exporter family transporter [Halobellus sp. H-GB7]MDQ2055974.1 putative sulfate exporter family transporter [Halobellus sp. H-GB7]